MYVRYLKRPLDMVTALLLLLLLLPLFLLLTVLGTVIMKGNPFFLQPRPGRNEQIFYLIKFRTMSGEKDPQGNLLPDCLRLNGYGKFLRKTSLDELPELLNILTGKMSLVGPRPLLCSYLPYYTCRERRRHSVRPGLTGLAQVSGRNALAWDQRFALDAAYVDHITFLGDLKILLRTVGKVISREDVLMGKEKCMENLDVERRKRFDSEKNTG